MVARYDGTCIKCGGSIKNGVSEIAWSRKPRPNGLKSAAWHLTCATLPDNPSVSEMLLKKQRERYTRFTGNQTQTIPAIQEQNETQTQTEHKNIMASDSFAETMANALLPYLDGKVSSNLENLENKIQETLEGLESKLQTMLDSHVKTLVIESKETGKKVSVGKAHYAFETLLNVVTIRNEDGFLQDVYLYGEPGTGKSSAAKQLRDILEQVCEHENLPFAYVPLNLQSTPSLLMGYYDAHGEYVETDFYKLYKNGGVFLIDEADNASGNLLTSLNSALANGRGSFPCGQVERHPNFVCIATGNTNGFGHNPKFPERQMLSGAIKDRFAFIEWSYDEAFERELALAMHDDKTRTAKWVDWVQKTRKYCAQYDKKLDVTPRASIRGVKMLDKFPALHVANMFVFRGYDKDSVTRILANNPLPF